VGVLVSFALFAVCRSLSCYRLTAKCTKTAKSFTSGVLASFALFAVCRSLSCYRLTAERTKNAKKSLSDTSARFTICRSLSLLKTYREVHEDREELYEWGLSELRALCGI
jgi:hypothetical protein